jgi:hypothetical protein
MSRYSVLETREVAYTNLMFFDPMTCKIYCQKHASEIGKKGVPTVPKKVSRRAQCSACLEEASQT